MVRRDDIAEDILVVIAYSPLTYGQGDNHYRVDAPARAMAVESGVYVVSASHYNPRCMDLFRKADILILAHNYSNADFLPILNHRKRAGKITVYEIADDIMDIPEASPISGEVNISPIVNMMTLARHCDILQFNTEELRKKYKHLNRTSFLFPNHILEVPEEKKLNPDEHIVVGWGGSSSHLQDLSAIVDILIPWLSSKDNIKLHFMGDNKIWSLFSHLPEHKKQRFSCGSIYDYYDFLKTIDIGIAPLGKTEFNRCRSDIKFLEYAMHGVVPVVQAYDPYLPVVSHGETGFLFASPDELLQILDLLASDFSIRAGVAKAARQYVLEKRFLPRHIGGVLAFYREHLGRTREIGALAEWFDGCSRMEGAVRDGRCIGLAPSRHDLIVPLAFSCGNNGKKNDLASLLSWVDSVQPENYLSPLLKGTFLAETDEAKIACLEEALAKNPESILAFIKLGMVYFEAGAFGKALDCLMSARKLFPGFVIPYLYGARVLETMGDHVKAKKFLDKANSL